jgi:dipeptidyl aminopeptidase/acylaminoacyl peptidase
VEELRRARDLGFLYRPPKRFTGKRPVLINIHGGPESQRARGLHRALQLPRGRARHRDDLSQRARLGGFGKTFIKLDNGLKREDSVKDIGALLDWIKEHPDLDADRVGIMGGSYGGYSRSRARCTSPTGSPAPELDGDLKLRDFPGAHRELPSRRPPRRVWRRARSADARLPESISPLNHADKIARPLFVVQGYNDPRVPYTEAEQIVATLKKRGTPVWFMMAGRGAWLREEAQCDYLFYATVDFARQTLLK